MQREARGRDARGGPDAPNHAKAKEMKVSGGRGQTEAEGARLSYGLVEDPNGQTSALVGNEGHQVEGRNG